jgi:hypothetical protein
MSKENYFKFEYKLKDKDSMPVCTLNAQPMTLIELIGFITIVIKSLEIMMEDKTNESNIVCNDFLNKKRVIQ